ncbi:Nuclear receptor coactivator 7,TLD domain-containing protein 2,Oxidation resistance protein 1 [Lepeophtheirus salmonis]|uniref:Oxidation resistance protein 1 n=1 Tax=Lepeophtheirus salmonis TaxID=72036 RepID=A0A7R8H2N6_LEPSM|nr:Nuclear receptor coactivator 7,TLD domain-containing protein 2,Oxidation resistance protein 1 [Lepeophtheirus salmonis]CAF2831011.1 Nuclear receptor coactivator 7,TLD domain-containing protein 2,Oxidation resistance protein 1 [Lepeophtheirus salmonis]
MDEKEDDFYMVKGEDETLDSIAARFLLSPNELVTLNRLGSRFVFKGQKLRIRFPTPKKSNHPSVDCTEEEDLFDSQFVRLGVSHVTDGRGIVRGSLLFTPKSFMFNPLPQDPLVLEAKDNNNESLLDSYQLIAPMDLVVCISLFKEFIKLNSVKDRDIIEEDDLLNTSEASMGTDETRYLRLAIGIPREEELAKNTPVISYGEQKLYPEYWFIVHLYEGGIYLDSSSTKKRGALKHFGHDLNLNYSTEEHGFSLKNLYRRMPSSDEEPVLLIIKDSNDNIFGAYLSCALRISEHFTGTGESFLFRTNPDIEVFRWTGENDYILKGETNSFGIGMSDGHFGLWLDEDLNLGRTERCSTFNNNPLTSHDFHVNNLECWTFTL